MVSFIRQSLRSQLSCKLLQSRWISAIRAHRFITNHQCWFRQQKLKFLSGSLSAQLECNQWQLLAAVCSRGTLSSTVPFQVDHRRSCWHRLAGQHVCHWVESSTRMTTRIQDPLPVCHWPKRANTSLKLCREAYCTLCAVKCATCRANSDLYQLLSTHQHSANDSTNGQAMLVGMDAILVCIFTHWHAVQNFEAS